jgi:hypothetical protein
MREATREGGQARPTRLRARDGNDAKKVGVVLHEHLGEANGFAGGFVVGDEEANVE